VTFLAIFKTTSKLFFPPSACNELGISVPIVFSLNIDHLNFNFYY
jgi:hypothetical protein